MCCSRRATIDSHEFLSASASPRSIRCESGCTAARSQALANCSHVVRDCNHVAELRDNVLHWSRNDRAPCRHVLKSFCWIDETRRLIHGERHDANIEPFHVARQVRVIAPAEPVQIVRRGKELESTFVDGPIITTLPFVESARHASSS